MTDLKEAEIVHCVGESLVDIINEELRQSPYIEENIDLEAFFNLETG